MPAYLAEESNTRGKQIGVVIKESTEIIGHLTEAGAQAEKTFIDVYENEIAGGAEQITNAVEEVNEITQKNKASIENLTAEVGKFKL